VVGGVVGGVPGGAVGDGAACGGCAPLLFVRGGGAGFAVVNRRSLPVTRPLSARTIVTRSRYVVLGVSGFARITLSVVNGPGRLGLRFTPVSAG